MPLCANTCTCSERSMHATLCQYLYVLRKVNACHSVPIPVRAPKGQCMPLCANTCTCSERSRHATLCQYLYVLRKVKTCHSVPIPVRAPKGQDMPLCANTCTCSDFVTALALLALAVAIMDSWYLFWPGDFRVSTGMGTNLSWPTTLANLISVTKRLLGFM